MQIISQLLAIVFVVSTMLAVGMLLSVRDISTSLHDRRWLMRALLANFLVLPALAFGVARLLDLDPMMTAGLLILATAPGGPVLVKLVALARGEPALAVGLLVTVLVLSVFTQPLVLPWLLEGVHVSARSIALTMLFTVLLPLIIGLVLRARLPYWATMLHKSVQGISTLCMLLICIVLPALHWQELLDISGSSAFPAAFLFLLLACLAGWLLGGPHPGPRRILSINCTQPNLAAALVIASQNFTEPKVLMMLLVILLASLPILLPLCLFYARQERLANAPLT